MEYLNCEHKFKANGNEYAMKKVSIISLKEAIKIKVSKSGFQDVII